MGNSRLRAFINQSSYAYLPGIAILAIALLGTIEVILATPYGPGVGSDAVVYLISAKNFLSGEGLGLLKPDGTFRLLPYFPPFYPITLSGVGLLVKDLSEGARWFNAILFGGLIAAVGLGFYRIMRNILITLSLTLMLAFSTVLLDDALWAMSEPLSLLLGFGGLIALASYYMKPGNVKFFASAVLVGLAFLTRYVGVAYCAAGCLSMLLFSGGGFGKRIRMTFLYGLISILPMAVWAAISMTSTGSLGSRSLPVAYVLGERMADLIMAAKIAFYSWTPYVIQASREIPQPWFRLCLVVCGAGILGAIFIAARKLWQQQNRDRAVRTGILHILPFLLFGVAYSLMIAVTYLFTFPPISLNDRMLSPLLVVYLVTIGWSAAILVKGFRNSLWVKGLVGLLFSLFIANYASTAFVHISEIKLDGLGYNERVYKESALVAYAQNLPESVSLISNKAAMLYYFTGRPVYSVQEVFSPLPEDQFLPFGSDLMDKVQQIFRNEGAALVLFNSIKDDFHSLYGTELGEARYNQFIEGLYAALQAKDGLILFYPEPVGQ